MEYDMDESSMGMSKVDIASLKDALRSQQLLLQKLYNELDVEREASSTAASEALSMILRLQGEKAAVKMEAEQFKRLAEEKMCYAEECLAIFEELIYQKEMEINAMDYQVQSYRHKLISLGCPDPGISELKELKFPDHLLQKNEALVGENIMRRKSALRSYLKGLLERERSASTDSDLIPLIEEAKVDKEDVNFQNLDCEVMPDTPVSASIHSYWEQIRMLDEKVRDITGAHYAYLRGDSTSFAEDLESDGMPYNSIKAIADKTEQVEHPEISFERGAATESSCSLTVHDVFEVPQTVNQQKVYGEQIKDEEELFLQRKERLGKTDTIPLEVIKSSVKQQVYGEQNKDRGNLVFPSDERLGKPDTVSLDAITSHVEDGTDHLKKMLLSSRREKNPIRPDDGVAVDCHFATVHPAIGGVDPEATIQHLARTSEIIEVVTQASRHEDYIIKEQQMKLLSEIKEQLSLIHREMKTWKSEISSPDVENSMLSLSDAMLRFWL